MAKKSFRTQAAPPRDYPRLVELEPDALRGWRLIVVGGLLLGGAACTRPEQEKRLAGEAPVVRAHHHDAGTQPDGKEDLLGQHEDLSLATGLLKGSRVSGTGMAPRIQHKKIKAR